MLVHDSSRLPLRKKLYWFLHKWAARGVEFFIKEHLLDAYWLERDLRKAGFKKPCRVVRDTVNYGRPLGKREHNNFIVIYYYPEHPTWDDDFVRWLYGIDCVERLIQDLSDKRDIHFIKLDGSTDMVGIYPLTDFMVRPNRHDGGSRMVRECIIQDIPFYWSNEFPSYEEMKDKLLVHYNRWKRLKERENGTC